MARKKQRENYGNGSVSPVMVKKLGADGNVVIGKDGKPVIVQERDKQGRLVWRVCVTLGVEEFTDKNGNARKRQRKVQKRVHGTLDDARQVAKQITMQHANIDLSATKATFADACKAWEGSMQENQTCAPSKLKDYMTRLSYVSAQLGNKPLVELTTDDLEQALSAVKAERNQSQRTYRDTKRHVKRVFKFAHRKHWVVFDPSEDLEKVSVRGRVERRSLDAADFARLRACIDRDLAKAVEDYEQKEMRQANWGNMFTRSSVKGLANIGCFVGLRLLCATGCRRGEVLALTWGKVDFESSSIRIDAALNADAELKEPKTDAGIRTIAIDDETLAILKRWKEFQRRALHLVMVEDGNGNKRPIGQNDSTPVVCSCVGTFLNPHNLNRWWNAYRVQIGFETLKLHELRHTAATLLLGNGMPVIDVAARLGHDDVSVTLNTYGHAIPAHDQMAATLIGRLMNAPAEPSGRMLQLDRKTA